MLKKAVFLLAMGWLLSSRALCQENTVDVALSGAGALGKVSSGNQVVQNVTNSFGILATLRLRFSPHSSIALNYGHTPDSQLYTTAGINYRVQDKVTEFSGVYMLNVFQSAKLEPFALAGLGALMFSPSGTFINELQAPLQSVKQTELATIVGAGFDYRLPWRFALRVQYRGLIYSAPDFKNSTRFTGAKGYYNEPSLGLVFKF